jgi:predicted oxidoreductase
MLEGKPTAQDINRRINACVELGITSIDTAEIYGAYKVEEALGEALALSPGLRDRITIITKTGIYMPAPGSPAKRVKYYDASATQIMTSAEKSLRLLQTDRLDVLLVHRPDWLSSIDDTAEGLNQLINDGKITAAGVSNYSAAQFEALASRMNQPLSTNQIEFSLLHIDPIHDGTLDQCQRLGIRPMAWSPLAGGKLFAKDSAAAGRLAAEAKLLADTYDGATLEQLAYAWVLAHPARPQPIIGSNRIERIETAARALSIKLEREDWYALWVAAQGRQTP